MNELDRDEIITIQELAKRTDTKPSYWYERSRHNAIAGMLRIGKFVRISWPNFLEAARVGGGRDEG